MFLAYQTNVRTGERFIAKVAKTREELENNKFFAFDSIKETDKTVSLIDGVYIVGVDIVETQKLHALSRIDSATSAAILAGFEYEVETGEGKEVLHFSYDSFDQQNFADTANAAMMAMQGVEGVPTSVTWNGWRNHTKEQKGELVRLTLDVSAFLTLYTGGALVHKATQMEIGGQRKAAIEAAETVEEINALLEGWGI